MRRLIVIGALTTGCIAENPAWQMTSAEGSSSSSSTSTPIVETTEATPTTSGAGTETGGSGSGAATTSGESTTSGVAPTTTGVDPTTGEGSSSTGDTPTCEATEVVPVALAPRKIEDTGVAPATMNPCPWAGTCETLNFGKTHYFRLVSTPALGKTVGLFRFDVGPIADWAASQGLAVENIIGFEFAVVVYEPRDLPAAPTILQVDAVAMADVDYSEGTKDAMNAADGDASGACKTRVGGACVPWSAGFPTQNSVTVGTIVVDDAAVIEHDNDGANNAKYHALLRTGVLPIAEILAVSGDGAPTFAVSLMTERGPEPGMEIGIKFEESPELEPALFAVVCTAWGP